MERPGKSRDLSRKLKFTREEVREDLIEQFPNLFAPAVLDEVYLVPTYASLESFTDEIHEWLADLGLTDEEGRFIWDEDYDCEDVTLLAVALAKIKHRQVVLMQKDRGKKLSKSPYLGLFCYDRKLGVGWSGHCLIGVRLRDAWHKLEPQTGEISPFKPEERGMCFHAIL